MTTESFADVKRRDQFPGWKIAQKEIFVKDKVSFDFAAFL
jgi:hypothetical protein